MKRNFYLLFFVMTCWNLYGQNMEPAESKGGWELSLGAVVNPWLHRFSDVSGDVDNIKLNTSTDMSLGGRARLAYTTADMWSFWMAIESGRYNFVLEFQFDDLIVQGSIPFKHTRRIGEAFYISPYLGVNKGFRLGEKSSLHAGLSAGVQRQGKMQIESRQTFNQGENDFEYFYNFNNDNQRWIPGIRGSVDYRMRTSQKSQVYIEVFYDQSLSSSIQVESLGYVDAASQTQNGVQFKSRYFNPGISGGWCYSF